MEITEMKRRCPQDEMLADYLEGRLSEQDRHLIEKHFSECDRCIEYLAIHKALMQNAQEFNIKPAPDHVARSVNKLLYGAPAFKLKTAARKAASIAGKICTKVAGRMEEFFGNGSAPMMVRSHQKKHSDHSFCIEKKFEGIPFLIEIEKKETNVAIISVRLKNNTEKGREIRVSLENKNREIASHLLDRGDAFFEPVFFDAYRLCFYRAGICVGAYEFILKETQHE